MSVLVIAEHIQGGVRDVTKELVTAAAELGGPVTVAIIAADPSGLVEQVNVAGVDEIVQAAAPTSRPTPTRPPSGS
jgi:electron transfer flavoprotein alpha subunit